jgi:hypothetical protein
MAKTKFVYIISANKNPNLYYRFTKGDYPVYTTREAARAKKATLDKHYKIFKVSLEVVR